ncbi:MAG: chromosome segregation protein SMC [Acidimicrobiia bacterium]|nr:chromosome segregation protein SMC [Acidimicrobiia bacterium]
MLLKTLSLAGFKSFADRTRLDFHGGVNVVVGPNGSGKSNLLDALAWVMGTQATTSLRTQKMEDVIFAGTATRPAIGRAEVTLTFDNADRFLPIDLDDVAMTRRLYRDGTSEYELNGTPCRLMDLHELLSDGGVGRHQHVLVGQGQIGNILNARPDEHRAVIEEAAGITKHRGRRDRSVRRLEQTELDVARLTDILDQQRRRLRPLKRQANAALRYDSVKAEVKALHLWLGGEQLRKIRSRTAAATAERAELEHQADGEQGELERIRADLAALEASAGEVGASLQRDTAAAARLETVSERYHRIAMVARERRQAMEGRLLGADERKRDLSTEVAHLEGEIAQSSQDEQAARLLAERREVTLQALEDEERSLAEQIALPAEGVIANLRGDLRALETAAERDRREREALSRRREAVVDRIEREGAESAELHDRIRSTDSEVGPVQARYEADSASREAAQEQLEVVESELQNAQIDLAKARGRAEAVEAALAGLGDPAAQERVAAHDAVIGKLVSHLDVPEPLAAAVDGVLGSWRDAYVAANGDAVADLAHQLKADGFGGVSVLAAGRGDESDADLARRVATDHGVEALVDRLGPAADRGLALHTLGDVVFVEGWVSGWTLVHRYAGLRAVTPEGDVITTTGIRLAEPDGAGPAAMEAAGVALETAERNVDRAEAAHTTVRREFDRARERERLALEELETIEARLAGFTEAVALVERAQAEGRAELDRLDERDHSLIEAAAARDERIAELRLRVAEFEGEERARQEAWDALNRRRDAVAQRRDEARRLREEAAGVLASAAERLRLLEGRLAAARTELHGLDEQPVDPAAIEQLSTIEDTARSAQQTVRVHIETLRERQRELRSAAGIAGSKLDEAHRRQRALEQSLVRARERMSALAVELAELRVRDESVAEGLRRDADATEETALTAPRPDLDDDADAAEVLASREAQLRRMGPINPLAAAEYEELAAEVEHLETQLADLEEARAELRKVIGALDDEMATLFHGAFDDIARFFEENFAEVFPGGKGRLRLTDPQSPLTTGVEIEAQPMGKKVGRLSLLSGGERSLAALAFLFAVFRARPSPFYVLDEVEAALDDANLRRFLRLVDMLRESAQLVIITHQQQTMEAADILYGVTMEPGESSLVVAKRLDSVKVG